MANSQLLSKSSFVHGDKKRSVEYVDLNNSMLPKKKNPNKSFCDASDDSFLEMERQCNLEESSASPSINETLLFDIEPPSNLWEQSSCFNLPALSNIRSLPTHTEEPFRLGHPSTIIEETSSQFSIENDKTGRSSNVISTSVSSSSLSSSSASVTQSASSSVVSNESTNTSNSWVTPPLSLNLVKNKTVPNEEKQPKVHEPKMDYLKAKRRETLVFKKKNYKFFTDEQDLKTNLKANTKMPQLTESANLIVLDSPAVDKSVQKNNFNDTLEEMDYFIEEGRRMLENEETPVCDRENRQNFRSYSETPFLSCKRTRILSEMSGIETLPIAKRGPLFDLSSPNSPMVEK